MNRMLKYFLFSFLFVAAGCSGARGTSTPSLLTPTTEVTPVSLITSRCSLLNSNDLANLYTTHTEVIRPIPQVSQVNHVAFSPQNVSTNEISCTYYVFHLPGLITGQTLQVSYWLDTPAQATPAAWARVWADASSKAPQSISGIGEGGFFEDGRLTFKKGDYYMTIEVEGTGDTLNTSTPAGVEDQLKIEKQVALDALKNF